MGTSHSRGSLSTRLTALCVVNVQNEAKVTDPHFPHPSLKSHSTVAHRRPRTCQPTPPVTAGPHLSSRDPACHWGASPVIRKTSPVIRGTASVIRGTSPVMRRIPPVIMRTPLVIRGTSPAITCHQTPFLPHSTTHPHLHRCILSVGAPGKPSQSQKE